MKNKKSTYQMWFLPIIFICVFIFYVWMVIYSYHEISSFSPILIVLVIVLTCITTYALVFSIVFGLAKIEFCETTIRKSFLNKYFVQEFLWAEVVEVKKIYVTGASNAWICISKIHLKDLEYNQIIRNKNVIRVTNNIKNTEMINLYYHGEIT